MKLSSTTVTAAVSPQNYNLEAVKYYCYNSSVSSGRVRAVTDSGAGTGDGAGSFRHEKSGSSDDAAYTAGSLGPERLDMGNFS